MDHYDLDGMAGGEPVLERDRADGDTLFHMTLELAKLGFDFPSLVLFLKQSRKALGIIQRNR